MPVVWWFPIEFWKYNIDAEPNNSELEKHNLLRVLKPYTIFAVAKGDLGLYGVVDYLSKEEIASSIKC